MAASLLGVWTAGESGGAITLTGRTSTSGSLITVTAGVWNGATISTPTDSFTNAYTERFETRLNPAESDGRVSLSYNIGGTRGGSHTISKADDASNSLGAQEWSGVAASPTIASAVAEGNSTAPAASVAVGAASLAVLVFGYAGAVTTFTTNDGTLAQEIDENSDEQNCGVHYKVGQTGTPSITATLAASREWGAGIVTFTEDTGGGGGTVTPPTFPVTFTRGQRSTGSRRIS